jgi:hypothetical protein
MLRPKEVNGTKSDEPSKIGHHFRKQIVSKIEVSKNVNNKRKTFIQMIIDIKN